jgi:YHS domain-containing protein
MKTPLLLFVALGLASCATKPTANPVAGETKATSKKVVTKVSAKPKAYPLKTCLVTHDDLDEMDERVSIVYEGQTFEFCCKPCLKKFNKNPGKYEKALAKAQR